MTEELGMSMDERLSILEERMRNIEASEKGWIEIVEKYSQVATIEQSTTVKTLDTLDKAMNLLIETRQLFRNVFAFAFEHYSQCDDIQQCALCIIMLREAGKFGLAIASSEFLAKLQRKD